MADLVEWKCGQCGVSQAMSAETNRVLRQSSATFYCVHGHARHYPQGKSETDKLRDELDRERRDRQAAAQQVEYWAQEARHQERRANGYKGHATRITKRAKAGVCPCCNRTFQQLARHMATQHPQFTPMDIDERAPEGATVQ